MKKRIRILIPVLAVVLATGLYLFHFRETGLTGDIRISGNIEVTDIALGFKIPGRLERRDVDEGDAVSRGQIVARLDGSDPARQVARAEAAMAYSEAVLAELEAGSRPEEIRQARQRALQSRYALDELLNGSRAQEIADAQAEVDRALATAASARVQRNQAQADLDRFASLARDGGISQRAFELYRTHYETAEKALQEADARVRSARERLSLFREGPRPEQIRKARAALQQAEAQYDLVQAGPRKETIDQARARVEEARQNLALARQQVADTELVAPVDGIVLSQSAEPGEFLNPGSPVVTIGDLKHPWLRAYVNETDLGRIRLNQPVSVSTDTYPEKRYRGRIRFISSQAEFTPKTVQTFEERVKLMYRIKIDLENPDGELKPGMPADAVIERKGPSK